MKKLITPLILMLLYVTNAMSCHSEHPHCVTVDGIHYAYEIRGKEVCDVFVYGFETAQDSIVLPTEVTIKGGKHKVTSVYIPDEYPSFLKIKTSSPKISWAFGILPSFYHLLKIENYIQHLHM